ncbi:MAG: hypothetical protein R6X23_12475 [Acidimicrobiia bacterium]
MDGPGTDETRNFGFLAAHDPTLAHYGGLAETYLDIEPKDTIVKIRQLAE